MLSSLWIINRFSCRRSVTLFNRRTQITSTFLTRIFTSVNTQPPSSLGSGLSLGAKTEVAAFHPHSVFQLTTHHIFGYLTRSLILTYAPPHPSIRYPLTPTSLLRFGEKLPLRSPASHLGSKRTLYWTKRILNSPHTETMKTTTLLLAVLLSTTVNAYVPTLLPRQSDSCTSTDITCKLGSAVWCCDTGTVC